jgi:putative peptide zinc metalloprotease protein
MAEVADRVSAASGRLVRPADVGQLVDASLRPLGLLLTADGSEPETRRSDPLLGLRLRRVVTDPAVTCRMTAPFAELFSPLVVVPVVLAFAAVAGWVLFSQGLAAATAQAFGNPALFVVVVAVTVLSAGFHEFGHAAAARYGGATPGAMGFGLYLFWPAFYTDVTDSYRLGRAGRVRTDLGGLYFNAVVVLLAFGVWWATGWHAVLLVVATQILQMVRQLAPLLRFDGYHVLADLTGVPDLYQRIGPVLRGLVPGRWRQPEAMALKTWARVVVIAWVLVVVPLMISCLLLVVLALPRVLGTAWAALQRQSALLGEAFADGDFLAVAGRALAMVAVVLPLLGLGYVLVRLLRRTAVAVWRRTRGRPVRRAVALVAAVAVAAGLAWAWWPDGGRYRPVQAWEGGTVLDALPAAATSPRDAGYRGAAATIWPDDAGPLPTSDDPVLALVLTPAEAADTGGPGGETAGTGAAAPTWVFPFDRPLPPEEGDNQALAVNTVDGSVRYDVSFSLVWADDDVLSTNEAYALASCRDCRTVAVAFQVVLVLGSVDVVVPQNHAVAANYNCLECVTFALATQLVVSVPAPLDDAGRQELAAIWEELQAFGAAIEDVPLAELRARLGEFEARILEVVRRSTGEDPATGDGMTPTTSDPATPTGGGGDGTAGETGTSDAGAGDQPASGDAATTGAPQPTGDSDPTGTTAGPTAGTAPGTPTPTPEPTPTDTASPSG